MKSSSNISKIIPYLLEYKWRVFFSLLFIVIGRVLMVVNPLIMKELIDTLTEISNSALPDVRLISILVVLYFVFRWGEGLFAGWREYIFATVDTEIKQKIPYDIFKSLLSLPVRFHTSQGTGGVARKVTRGTSALGPLAFFFTGVIVPTILEMIFILVVLLLTFPPIFGIVFLVLIVAYLTYTIIETEHRQKLLLEANKRDDKAGTQSVDALLNFETVKYFTNEEFEVRRYKKTLRQWGDIAVRATRKGAHLNIWQGFIITLGMTVLLGLATREFLNGNATIGDFVLILSYINIIAVPMSFLGTIYKRLKESLANVDEMFKLLNVQSTVLDKKGAGTLQVSEGEIVLNDVGFGYNENRKVLNSISLEMPAKKSVALVGYSGSGKSTISKLLVRLYDVTSGSITIDGVDVRDVTKESLRDAIGVVSQDTILFNDTIYQNILYGRPDASEEEVFAATRLANIHEFIESLPEGYKTSVGERGLKLSGGEKQRVAIARMMLKDPSILIFDEATASLDSKSEKSIQDAIQKLSKEGRTTVVIAHRLSTIVDFDKIVVMEEGKIIEQGTHEELLKDSRVYKKLWEIQGK